MKRRYVSIRIQSSDHIVSAEKMKKKKCTGRSCTEFARRWIVEILWSKVEICAYDVMKLAHVSFIMAGVTDHLVRVYQTRREFYNKSWRSTREKVLQVCAEILHWYKYVSSFCIERGPVRMRRRAWDSSHFAAFLFSAVSFSLSLQNYQTIN